MQRNKEKKEGKHRRKRRIFFISSLLCNQNPPWSSLPTALTPSIAPPPSKKYLQVQLFCNYNHHPPSEAASSSSSPFPHLHLIPIAYSPRYHSPFPACHLLILFSSFNVYIIGDVCALTFSIIFISLFIDVSYKSHGWKSVHFDFFIL